MEPGGWGHFRRERLHTDRYIQRLDVTAHTHREKYIYKCMYISEMPHWGRNVAALYIYTQIHVHIFITWKMLSKGADGLGSKRSWSRGQVGGGGEGGLCSAFTLKALSFQPVFPQICVCIPESLKLLIFFSI